MPANYMREQLGRFSKGVQPMNTIKITMAALVLVFAYSLADYIERTNAPINADIRLNTLEKE